jgi:hypothetical protein
MKIEIKKLWTAALRSGEFKQGYSRLRYKEDGNRWCCLGVLCELHRQVTGLGRWRGLTYKLPDGDQSSHCLPYGVAEWAGLPICEDSVGTKFSSNPDAGGWSLSAWNDGAGPAQAKDFNEIADLIEEHL